jgi:hypothetical protein
VPQLRPQLPVGTGGLTLVTSPYQNAAAATQANDWHAVAVVRRGNTLWIFNPEFRNAEYAAAQQPLRLVSIHGVRIVQSLVKAISKHGVEIQHCFITGISEQNNMSCIGRSVQWMEGILDGTN